MSNGVWQTITAPKRNPQGTEHYRNVQYQKPQKDMRRRESRLGVSKGALGLIVTGLLAGAYKCQIRLHCWTDGRSLCPQRKPRRRGEWKTGGNKQPPVDLTLTTFQQEFSRGGEARCNSIASLRRTGVGVHIRCSKGKCQASSHGFLGLLSAWCPPGRCMAQDWLILVTGKLTSGILCGCILLVPKIQGEQNFL